MFYLIQTYWLPFAIALILGILSGYWAWARGRATLSGATGAMTGSLGGVSNLAAGAAAGVTGVAGAALEKAKTAADTVVDTGKSMAGGAVDAASGAMGAVTGAAGAAVDSVKSATGDAAGVVSGVAGAATGAVAAGAAGVAALVKPKIAPAVGAPDDLLQIKGIGPKLNDLCHRLGVTRFDQIAKWGAGDIAEVDQHLGTFRGRIVRDGWIEQAGLLASGNTAAFEAKFGKLDSENK